MTVEGFWTIFGIGCIGGCLAEFASIYKLRTEASFPEHYRRFRYYIISAVMILVGGGLTVIYGIQQMPVIMALNLGASAPLILQKLLVPVVPQGAKPVPDNARVG